MAVRDGEVKLTHQELLALCSERDLLNEALQQRIAELELERDRALRGLEFMTEALRRRGCCDHDTARGSL